MKIARTPDRRFSRLKDYPFLPHYCDLGDVRMHYVDEGTPGNPVILLMHGEPTWSYLYRFMIPVLVRSGYRVIAPDLIGFGKSDKPTSTWDYSYKKHVKWVTCWLTALDLSGITLFCHDWGSLIGLRVAAENTDRFSRIVLGNGGMPVGDEEVPLLFRVWKMFARWSPWFPVGTIVDSCTRRKLSGHEKRAYDAPFPSNDFKKGARIFPKLVPTSLDNPDSDDNLAAWKIFETWDKPFLTLFSSHDPITRGRDRIWQEKVPGAKGQSHTIIKNAGHFLQEDKGEEIAQRIITFINGT